MVPLLEVIGDADPGFSFFSGVFDDAFLPLRPSEENEFGMERPNGKKLGLVAGCCG